MGQILFLVAAGEWAVLEIYLHVFRRGGAAPDGSGRSGVAERLSKLVMLAVFAFAGFGARILTPDFAAGFRLPFTPVRWAGAALVLASVPLRILSVVQLGGGYSVDLGVHPGQPLVTTGLYQFVRHPGYLSLIVAFTGVGLAFWHWLATPLCLLLPPGVLAWRIRLEERILERTYGEEYRAWARRTRRLVPFVL
jgi:protein-S-isoprenylcysteine O-methyltransferase Ste14